MLYFGVEKKDRAGHYLFDEQMRSLNYSETFDKIDGGFCPQGPEKQGVATLTHINGQTVLAFWDRSGDSRFGSNSNFIEKGTLSFDEMLCSAKEKFPLVFERLDFDIIEKKRNAVSS